MNDYRHTVEQLAASFGYQITYGTDNVSEIAQHCAACVTFMPQYVWGKARNAVLLKGAGLGGSHHDVSAIAAHALDLFARWLHQIVGDGDGWRPSVVTTSHLDNIYPAQIRTSGSGAPFVTARFTPGTAAKIMIDLQDSDADVRLYHGTDGWVITAGSRHEQRVRPDGDDMLALNTAELAWQPSRTAMLMRTAAAIDTAPIDPASARTPAAGYGIGLAHLREHADSAAAHAITNRFDKRPMHPDRARLIRDAILAADPATLNHLARPLLRLTTRDRAAACWNRRCHTGALPYAKLPPLHADDVADLYAHTFHRAAAAQALTEIRSRFPNLPA
ncbi:hypothetical protein AB0B31_11060 [Catellatospora citrea]|uniref:hypothetical protein n=1 Tax=Catellatospora citrea TaxID=53366 RepID=UPI0033C6B89B